MSDDVFRYQSFQIEDDRRTVRFNYQILHDSQTYDLNELLTFPVNVLDSSSQLASLRALHLALGVSYYKIFVPPTIEHSYAMSGDEAEFWNTIWHHGLGEFLYVNQLSADTLAKFSAQSGQEYHIASEPAAQQNGALLGIGGGKDSIVAGELLKSLDIAVDGFVMATGEQRGQAQAVADTMGIKLFAVNRVLDKQLLDLQEQPGTYKGHIPISLIFGLVGTTLAIASGKQYVIVANEASASIPRIQWQNEAVNHQWSKSFGFEKNLQNFVLQNIAPSVTYFSAVRQLTSIGVAKLFSKYQQYFEVFTSDNFIFRIDPAKRPSGRWSLESPKSLSSYILLAPWISETNMQRIFEINFLDQAGLETLFTELVGLQGEPPLDCVGTVDELILSLNLAAQQGKFLDTHLIQLARKRGVITDENWQSELTESLALQPEQALPEELELATRKRLQKELES